MKQIDFLMEAKEIEERIVRIRREIHMNPELGTEEFKTAEMVETRLQAMGIETKRVAKTGVVGLLKGSVPGKTVALRADMDALPIGEKNVVEYTSKIPGKMHACGHDAHTAGLLGAAMLLSKFKSELKGNVKFLFQPAEETCGGALPMIQEGVLENPKVDAVFGLHCNVDIDAGKIGVVYGKAYAASDTYKAIIKGRGSHGALPHQGVDAIAIGAQVVSALQIIVSRNVDPVDSAVVTVGVFRGGYQGNVIADQVEMAGIIRTLDPEMRKTVCEKVKRTIVDITTALGAEAEFTLTPSYPSLINNKDMTDLVKITAKELLDEDKIVLIEKPTMGVEDFSYLLQEVPGSFIQLGVRNEQKKIVYPLHNSRFNIDEDALPIASAMHAKIAFNYLNS